MDIRVVINGQEYACADLKQAQSFLERVEEACKTSEEAISIISRIKEICKSNNLCDEKCLFWDCGLRDCYFANNLNDPPSVWTDLTKF